ncbi:MAG TPA: hypothetical protein ENN03_10915 [bacterium]|nr:hypothetical protein [bacterium]
MKAARVVLFLLLIAFAGAAGQNDRYYDQPEQGAVHVTVLYPSTGTLRSILGLREQGLFPADLRVVGVYHAEERTDYSLSRAMVEEMGLDWFHFHRISAKLHPENLFGANECTPEFRNVFEHSDAMIFFGGADIPPYLYGEEASLLSEMTTPVRSFFELSFIFHLLGGFQDIDFVPFLQEAPNFPVLGICLGAQSLNVGTGGTLIQDIWTEIYECATYEAVIGLSRERWHTNPMARLYAEKGLLRYNMHCIRLLNDGLFVRDLSFSQADMPLVVSSHHQAVGKPGLGLTVIATSMDGRVAEAIGHRDYPAVLGVQFHPEFPMLYDASSTHRIHPDDEPSSLRAMLEANEPSFEFHRALWDWFFDKVKDCTDQ